MNEALRLLDELIERVGKFWPGSAELLQLETLHRDLQLETFIWQASEHLTIEKVYAR